MASLKKKLQNTILHKESLDPSYELMHSPQGPIMLFKNGLLQHENMDYTIDGSQITWLEDATPLETDYLYVYYMKNREGVNQSYGFANLSDAVVQADLELERVEKLAKLKKFKEKQYQRLKAELEPSEIPEDKLKKYQERIEQNIEKPELIKDVSDISDERLRKYQERISRSKE